VGVSYASLTSRFSASFLAQQSLGPLPSEDELSKEMTMERRFGFPVACAAMQ